MGWTRTIRSVTTTASNWAGNQRWLVAERVAPRSSDEVVDVVRRAAATGGRVKAIGAGHSFTAVASTDGIQVSLDAMSRVLDVDVERGRVRVQAGIRLRALNDQLAAVGLAMPNLGDIDRQSIAGAIATATHGTGLGLGNLATTVVGMELVTGTGDVVRIDDQTDPELLRIARVGLGALGIVTEVTLQCVPAFVLHARETIEPLDDVLDGLLDHAAAVDHFELYWMPGGGTRCQVKRNRRTDEPARPQSRLGYARDKWVGENAAFGLVCRVGRRFPTAAPRIAKLVTGAAGERDLVDRSDRIFCSPRRVHFVEMEYGIPIEHLPEAVRRLREFARRLPIPVLFPVEVRVSAADDIPLSTAFGRTSGWVAVHQYQGMPHEEYFAGVERIMDDYGGRPHWGKLHGQRAATLVGRYPQWGDFRAARDRLDPDRTFANAYLDRVLD
ncbi:MAG: D-arabinono-1,4-lactone oxidase [Ilumatobacteraceae bacterium]